MSRLKRRLLRYLFNTVSLDDVLQVVKDKDGKMLLKVGDNLLPEAEYKAIRADARSFKYSRLWKHLLTDLTWEGNRSIYESKNYEDTYFGKAILFAVKIMDQKIELLARDDDDVVG